MCGHNLTKDTEVVELLQPYGCDRCVLIAKSAWDTMQIWHGILENFSNTPWILIHNLEMCEDMMIFITMVHMTDQDNINMYTVN